MNESLEYCVYQIFRLLNYLVPKQEHRICIHTFPDYDDMTRGLLEGLSKSAPEFQITILTDGVNSPPSWAEENRGHVQHYRKYSMRGFWAYFRSKYVFFTHGCFSSAKPVRSQISVNVWHGMPIKTIGRYLGQTLKVPLSTYAISTSPFFSDIIARAFSIPEDRVLEVGLPRNDILQSPANESLKRTVCRSTEKLVLWLPTYRQSVVGDIRSDGEKMDNVFHLPDLKLEELDSAFKKMGVHVLIKPHPMATRAVKNVGEGSSENITQIDELWLYNNQTTLYEILSISDLLITDISSVLIDYTILGKPIVCHFPDLHIYRNNRGLIWDFDPTAYGIPLVSRQSELIDAVREGLRDTAGSHLYPVLRQQMHSTNGNYCKNLFAALGI